MCGIAGILLAPGAADPGLLDHIDAMATALTHRGPDGCGVWIDREAGVALAHRRLAIVDLSETGRQPMVSHSRRQVITFNGEIYNFAELRTELAAAGHRFRGHSDTEVMLAAIESLGFEAALARFAGMFAFAIWDRADRTLHLVRDRIGKKPLYIGLVRGGLVFASELKALHAFPQFRPELDHAALASMLSRGWVPDGQCIWSSVFKLPPGNTLRIASRDLALIGIDDLRRRAKTYWSLAEVATRGQEHPLALGATELEDALDDLLRTVVGQRMVADVPLGAFLSGGIDSSTVVALMQAQSSRPVRTFSIGFRESGYDESRHAAAVARHFNTEHTEFHVTAAEARDVIPMLPRIWDEPFADESQIPTFLLSQLARRHVTVALSGDGGDECFGGYTRHLMVARTGPLFRLPTALRRSAASAMRFFSPQARRHLLNAMPLPARLRRDLSDANLQRLGDVLDAPDDAVLYERLTTFRAGDRRLFRNGADAAAMPWPEAEPRLPDALGRFMYRDMAGYLPGDILVKVDRASMAVGLEARSPLLDHRLIEFAWRVPNAFKVNDGKGKWLLRQVLRRYLPETLFERPKQGFNVPIGSWLLGPLRDWALDLIDPVRIRRDGLLDVAAVEACWREHSEGRRDCSTQLWAILMLQAWLDTVPGSRAAVATPRGGTVADRIDRTDNNGVVTQS